MKLVQRTHIIAFVVALCSIASAFSSKTKFTTQSKSKSKNESMMEYLNNYFSDNNNQILPTNLHEAKHKMSEFMGFKENEPAAAAAKAPEAAPAATTPAPPANKPNTPGTNPNLAPRLNTALNVVDNNQVLESWFTISSPSFNDKARYPDIRLESGKRISINTEGDYRINESFGKGANGPANMYKFYFRFGGDNIYYTINKDDMNVLGAINAKNIVDLQVVTGVNNAMINVTDCLVTKDKDNTKWNICGNDLVTIRTWGCRIKNLTNTVDPLCHANVTTIRDIKIEEVKVTQPVIIIPLPSRTCNEDYSYKNLGTDWECDCTGTEQSPIDLPVTGAAVPSPVKPFLQYQEINPSFTENSSTGQTTITDNLTIRLEDQALRIKHGNLGKLVQMDGGVYKATEIVFRTPAEHTIDGKKYDMEVQIIHEGISSGDLSKHVILSFLFEKHPGYYNKFLDDIDIFNLPNVDSPIRNLKSKLFIPKIFYNADDPNPTSIRPFSFYTYQGSLTAPPCTENTVIYVASQPIKVGSTALQMFQEALRIPDSIDTVNNIINVSNQTPNNNRKTQPINGRTVFHYDHVKYCGPDMVERPEVPKGHYEKTEKVATQYFYVNTPEPSGLPGAIAVSDDEAKGKA